MAEEQNVDEGLAGEEHESDEESFETVEEMSNGEGDPSEDGSSEGGAVGGEPVEPEDPSKCAHYDCKCSIIAPCCKKLYFCRLCHNAAETHEVDRFAIAEIVCRDCETHQPPAEKCSQCGVVFGGYCCLKCRLYDFTDKGQWHCEGCGICRAGGRDNYFHCDRCGYCLSLSLKETHSCVPDASKNNCAICFGGLHDSRDAMQVAKCGHPFHGSCFNMMLKHGSYACPICRKGLVDTDWTRMDEIAAEVIAQIPADVEIKEVAMICNDCLKKGTTKDYIIVAMKCPNCGSYNTQK